MSAPALTLPPRRMTLISDREVLWCPDGHPIPRDAWIPGAAAVRCRHRTPVQGALCSHVVLVLAMGDGVRALLEITPQEAMKIEAERMRPGQMLDFLRVPQWTPTPTPNPRRG